MADSSRLLFWPALQIIFHVIKGALILIVIFPFAQESTKKHHIQTWSRQLLKIFKLKLKVINAEYLPKSGGYLISANHISWIDIASIHSFLPCRFVAKSEVASWPIFGWMARQTGTLFIRRDNKRHGKEIAKQLEDLLPKEPICIFPEGTSTAGDRVLPFKTNLFESAAQTQVQTFPMAIRYRNAHQEYSDATAFIGDMTLIDSIAKMLRAKAITVELIFAPSPAVELDRKDLALYCENQVRSMIETSRS
ncbi:lysophospholipid acyltransferase family protein [Polynucleobacter sp. HIN7]|uniref:lysophospholipid acyltransferase family protein n=1 Tax=Polynucleobacter sp. HIN7 TaxID=3047866 RepID=UPI002573C8A3|nr:lysophospholipid acyltransferase family protein [Polynucleobacter sp. HIN7]